MTQGHLSIMNAQMEPYTALHIQSKNKNPKTGYKQNMTNKINKNRNRKNQPNNNIGRSRSDIANTRKV